MLLLLLLRPSFNFLSCKQSLIVPNDNNNSNNENNNNSTATTGGLESNSFLDRNCDQKNTMKDFNFKSKSKSQSDNEQLDDLMISDDVTKLYVDTIQIGPIKINVSFIISPHSTSHSQRWGAQVQGASFLLGNNNSSKTQGLFSTLSLFMWQIGEVVLDLSSTIADAPIYINGFFLRHLFKTDLAMIRTLNGPLIFNVSTGNVLLNVMVSLCKVHDTKDFRFLTTYPSKHLSYIK